MGRHDLGLHGARASACPSCRSSRWGWCRRRSRYVTKKWQDCNWVQSVEGALDTAHFSFLHAVLTKDEATARAHLAKAAIADQSTPDDRIRWIRNDPRPKFTVLGHDAGLLIGAARKTDAADLYWRISQFLMPNHAYTPTAFPGEIYYGQCWVPVDDVTCWIYTYCWQPDRPFSNAERAKFDGGFNVHAEVDDDYMPLRNLRNDYLIDRKVQKHRHLHRHRGRERAGRRDPGQHGPDPGPHARASRPDRRGRRRVPQAADGRGARAAARRRAEGGAASPTAMPCAPAAAVAAPDKDLAAVMTERFGHRARLCRQAVRTGRLMLSQADNEFLTQQRPRHADGRAAAPLLDAGAAVRGAARTRRPAQEDQDPGRGPAGLPRHRRQGRHRRAALPASRRQSLLRPQRGLRHALRLPRLEVRRRAATASTCRPRRRSPPTRTRSSCSPIRRANGAT